MEEKNTIQRQEEIFWNILWGNVIIIIILLLLHIVEIGFILERAIKIFSFWIIIFLVIFLPRRILRNSKKFRYFVLYLRKHYPIIFYYNFIVVNLLLRCINLIYVMTSFYLERVIRYLIVGTKVKLLNPYKENWEKGEFILKAILEVYSWIYYIYIYIYKIFYEIILFFDTASVYKIIRSRILGFMMVTIGYIIIGVNFFIIYVLTWIIGFFLYTGIHIYVNYKRTKRKDYDLRALENINVLFGYYNYIILVETQINELKWKIMLLIQPIKFKKGLYYNSIKRKYGIEVATKYYLTIFKLITVRKDNLIYISKVEAEKKNIRYIYLAKYKFFTDFHLKYKWYHKRNSILENDFEDSYINTWYKVNDIPNLYFFYIHFIAEILWCFILDEKELNEENEKECMKSFNEFWNKETKEGRYFIGYLNEFFEFKDIYKFIKIIEKKKNEIGFEGFKKKLQEIDFFILSYNIIDAYKLEIINRKETYFLLNYELSVLFLQALEIKYDKEAYIKISEHLVNEEYESYKEKIDKKLQ